MDHQNHKTYGTILVILAVLFLVGLLSHWRLNAWLFMDWVAVAVCGYIGIKLYNKE
jgi:hypothetical protein